MKSIKNLGKIIIQRYKGWRLERAFERKNTDSTVVEVGRYSLTIPGNHILRHISRKQPMRDFCVGISAKFFGEKYPGIPILDIGANVGDTAAMIATYAQNPLILVEPSEFYRRFLIENIRPFEERVKVLDCLVGDGTHVHGKLRHRGGTAFFDKNLGGVNNPTTRVADLDSDGICFMKTDTDGFDFEIISSSIGWLGLKRPGLLFECEVRNQLELGQSHALFSALSQAGYRYFILWDDAGHHMLSTECLDTIYDLITYLFKSFTAPSEVRIYNYDVLCVAEKDFEIFKKIDNYFKADKGL